MSLPPVPPGPPPGPPSGLPPELDPRGPRPKVRRSRQVPADTPAAPGRRRWPVLVAGGLASLVLVFSVVGSALASFYFSKFPRVSIGGSDTDAGQPQNWLLVGSDNRAGLTKEEIAALHVGGATTANASGRRSDTMILLHLSAGTGKATLISLPRDSYVTIPAYKDSKGRQHAASHNKLNASYDLGGPDLTVRTVELATGLTIDHYVEVGFGGFVRMVDTLGGVSVCSTTALHDPKSGLNIKSGTTTLNGKQALAYVRARYVDPTADLGRMKRQQAFLGSLFRTALSSDTLLNPLKLNSFLSATLSSITLDDKVTRDDLLNLAASTKGLSPASVVFATVPLSNVDYRPSPSLGSTVLWDTTKATALWAALKADQPIGSQVAKGSASASAIPVQVAPARIMVQVSNGGGVSGAGAKAADDLTKLGFALAGPATNSTLHGVTQTLITYDPRYDVSLKTLKAAFPDAAVKAVKGQGRTFQLIVGSDYQAPKAVAVIGSTATTTPGGIKTTSAAQTVCKTS